MIRTGCIAILTVAASTAAQADSFMPNVIRWGASVSDMQTALKGKCAPMNTRPVVPPFLDNTKTQMQIDCENFQFQGKPRHAEFVIGDDRLKMVWIMTGPDEDTQLRAAMAAEYGPPDHRNKQYDAFVGRRAALRLDLHEVLFYAPDAAGDTEPDFAPDKQP